MGPTWICGHIFIPVFMAAPWRRSELEAPPNIRSGPRRVQELAVLMGCEAVNLHTAAPLNLE